MLDIAFGSHDRLATARDHEFSFAYRAFVIHALDFLIAIFGPLIPAALEAQVPEQALLLLVLLFAQWRRGYTGLREATNTVDAARPPCGQDQQ